MDHPLRRKPRPRCSCAPRPGPQRGCSARGGEAQRRERTRRPGRRIQCRRRPKARLRPGVPAASLAPATDHLSSASTPAQRSLPSEHTLPRAVEDLPQPLVGDHHGGDQQRMQHQGALPISAPEPGGDSAGGQVHPHFSRGRQRHYWGECCIQRKSEEGRDANIFLHQDLAPTPVILQRLRVTHPPSAAAPPLPCIRMAGCGLPRPAAKSLQSGRGLLHRHREPQLVFATLLKCSHPLEPVPCFGDPPYPESAFSLCYWLASLPQSPRREGKISRWARSEMGNLGSLWRNE